MSKAWPKVRLGEVLKRSERTVMLEPDRDYREITVRLWGKGVVLRRTVKGAEIAASRRFEAKAGQLILSRIDARNGAVGLVPRELDGAVVTNDFPLFDIDDERLDRRFVAWLSRTKDFIELLRRASEGTTNRVRLQEGRFVALEIALPQLSEQRRIVAQIEKASRQSEEAVRLRQESNAETSALFRASTEVTFQTLCRDVEMKLLKDVCRTVTDGDHNTPPFSDDGVRFIFVGNVSTGRLHFENCKRVSEHYFATLKAQRVPERGDILYSAVGATLGVPVVVDTDERFCFQRHIAILKPDHGRIDSRFLWHMLSSRRVFERAWGSTTGSAQPTIPLRAIRELEIPVPPLEMQGQISAYLDDVQEHVNSLNRLQTQTAAELDALLPSILDKAFRGEL